MDKKEQESSRRWIRALGKAMRQSLIDEYEKMGIPKGHPARKIGPIYIRCSDGSFKKYEGEL